MWNRAEIKNTLLYTSKDTGEVKQCTHAQMLKSFRKRQFYVTEFVVIKVKKNEYFVQNFTYYASEFLSFKTVPE